MHLSHRRCFCNRCLWCHCNSCRWVTPLLFLEVYISAVIRAVAARRVLRYYYDVKMQNPAAFVCFCYVVTQINNCFALPLMLLQVDLLRFLPRVHEARYVRLTSLLGGVVACVVIFFHSGIRIYLACRAMVCFVIYRFYFVVVRLHLPHTRYFCNIYVWMCYFRGG